MTMTINLLDRINLLKACVFKQIGGDKLKPGNMVKTNNVVIQTCGTEIKIKNCTTGELFTFVVCNKDFFVSNTKQSSY